MTGAQIARLPGGRLHFHHGPIDLILAAEGPPAAVRAAEARAAARFDGLLEELVAELPALRSPAPPPLAGPIARAMDAAVAPYRPAFITPMAAVAGAVADAVCAAMAADDDIIRVFVNNGGDIAVHLTPGTTFTAAIAGRSGVADRLTLHHADPVRGVATSGWRGRSFSLGIADAVTVLARSAAEADAAATMIANAVDLPGHPAIIRRPAVELQADTDLGTLPVTTGVGRLAPAETAAALEAGAAHAATLLARSLIAGAALFLNGEARLVGRVPAEPEPALA